jgi:hypothetical protein
VLGNCQTLIRSLADPRDRLGIIPLHTQTSGVHLPEVELGKRTTLFGKGTQYLERHTVAPLRMAAVASSSGPAVVLATKHSMNIMAPKIDLDALILFPPSS